MSRPHFRVCARPTFFLYLAVIALFSSVASCMGVVAAFIVHEIGHLLAAVILHEPISSVELAPFGGVIRYRRQASKGVRGVLVASAGPLANYLMILLLGALPAGKLDDYVRAGIIGNLSMMLMNLLPVLPLDGGSILFSIGYYLFDIRKLIGVLSALGCLTGACLCILSVYGWARWAVLNLSLPIVGCHLMISAFRTRENLLVENLMGIFQERSIRSEAPELVSIFRVSSHTPLQSLVMPLCRTRAAAFIIEEKGCTQQLVSDIQVLNALMASPGATIRETLEKQAKKKHFSP